MYHFNFICRLFGENCDFQLKLTFLKLKEMTWRLQNGRKNIFTFFCLPYLIWALIILWQMHQPKISCPHNVFLIARGLPTPAASPEVKVSYHDKFLLNLWTKGDKLVRKGFLVNLSPFEHRLSQKINTKGRFIELRLHIIDTPDFVI